ncbi:hypothetical protein COJ48_26965 [Bacillus cereus]|uniref:Methanol dehydrogenase n=2 Tax=Bacillus paramycoides TaxID=2026194 RepID=A0ABU6MZQ4_9BACI|nr:MULTISPECIES: hypothetical protein [Bacillus]EJR47291.1 hypothetical protein IIM_04537 [Bacillus cereus VD107]PFD37130.1 hypothetical protein CN285_20195 [Bacillus cereus]KMN42599.1 methanol dehydrogenase [Bacillus sp. LK2]MED0958582.1 hypothetical protein [Bacillus paramycoides]MED0968053.1 hypothetical protein [Bacillus paramycoides]
MGFVIAALLFCVLVWMIAASVKSNNRRVNLTKKSNAHNISNTSSPSFFFAGSDSNSSHDGGHSHDCGGSFGGDSGGSCDGGGGGD